MHPDLKNIAAYLDVLTTSGTRKNLPKHDHRHAYCDFSSNDYCQLGTHPLLLEQTAAFLQKEGLGSSGSRLQSGNHPVFGALETKIAQSKHTESALIFNSGSIANDAMIRMFTDTTLFPSGSLFFFDKLNHASLYEGIASSTTLRRYAHLDMQDLRKKLIAARHEPQTKIIVTETHFGMDGDVVDLKALVSLCQEFNTWLYLDEAHATGIFGPQGYGLSESVDLSSIPHIIMGTFSKAIGGFGAYVATHHIIKDYLINRAKRFIYTTALPPAVIYQASLAWDLLPSFQEKRRTLLERAEVLKHRLIALGYAVSNPNHPSNIIPILCQTPSDAQALKQSLLEQQIIVSALWHPTVPLNASRVRIALHMGHTDADIEKLCTVLSLYSPQPSLRASERGEAIQVS